MEAVCWLYRLDRDNLTDLSIPKHLIRRFTGSPDVDVAVKDLVSCGFWRDDGNHWTLVHHADVVRGSLGAQRKKRQRDKKAQAKNCEQTSPGCQ